MKSMTCIVLESYAYNNVLVIKYFCAITNFSRTYSPASSGLSNPEEIRVLNNPENIKTGTKRNFLPSFTLPNPSLRQKKYPNYLVSLTKHDISTPHPLPPTTPLPAPFVKKNHDPQHNPK